MKTVQGKKDSVVPVQHMKAYRGSRAATPLILHHGTRRKWVVDFVRWQLYHREKTV